MKKFATFTLVIAGILIGGYYLIPLSGLLLDNRGAERVVLLHGLGRNETAMLLLEGRLRNEGYDVRNIGYPSNDAGPEELIRIINAQIDECCEAATQPIHFVGHSLGGLLIRAYLADRRPHKLGRVVLLGAPNAGSELADQEDAFSSMVVEHSGPAALALGTGPEDFPASLAPPDYPVGVIAGTLGNPVSDQWLPQPNDGMVSVASARLEGMGDFIEMNVTHWGLRNDADVAEQVAHYLREGRFQH